MFQYEQIQNLNEREFTVYNYVTEHLDKVEGMNIRELSEAAGVSTTTILRFCNKIGCNGYKEFKYQVRKSLEPQKEQGVYFPTVIPAIKYLQHIIDDAELKGQIEQSIDLCIQAKQVLFLGFGTSGSLSTYGARLFTGVGVTSYAITDPFHSLSLNNRDMRDVALIVLSVSGETPETISLVTEYKRRGARIISITNTNQCTISKMSEINFAYYMPFAYLKQGAEAVSLTTQIPVVCLIERITQGIYEKNE